MDNLEGIRLYPEMNKTIVELLIFADEPVHLYAAKLIKTLQEENEQLRLECERMGSEGE